MDEPKDEAPETPETPETEPAAEGEPHAPVFGAQIQLIDQPDGSILSYLQFGHVVEADDGGVHMEMFVDAVKTPSHYYAVQLVGNGKTGPECVQGALTAIMEAEIRQHEKKPKRAKQGSGGGNGHIILPPWAR